MRLAQMPKIFQPFQCEDLVRLGKENDGGYLVNRQDVVKTTALISLGVGADISFERAFTKMNECPVMAYDKSVSRVHTDFFVGNKRHLEEHVGVDVRLGNVLNPYKDGVFLKCDIDGAEYNILGDIIDNFHKFTGIAMEFHDITQYPNFNKLTNFIAKVGLKLVHNHPNNYAYIMNQNQCMPDVIELSFTSSPNIRFNENLDLPHPLDMPNNPLDEEIKISF